MKVRFPRKRDEALRFSGIEMKVRFLRKRDEALRFSGIETKGISATWVQLRLK